MLSKPSPNFWKGRKGYKPEAIVIHITDGTAQSCIFTFTNPDNKVSAHYLVTKTGEIIQFVAETDTAWHAGRVKAPTWPALKPGVNPNLYTIGIELEGKNNDMPTVAQTIAAVWLVNKICANWSIPLDVGHIVPHNAINSAKECPGRGIQVGCLIWLAQVLGNG
jgi:N-acetyl-anhydromuramyl-L-alanine amidase AmpD